MIQLAGALKIVAERLLDDHATPAIALIQLVLTEQVHNFGVKTGLGGEIEKNIPARFVRLLDLIQLLTDVLIRLGVVDVAGNVEQTLRERVPDIFIEGRVLEEFRN